MIWSDFHDSHHHHHHHQIPPLTIDLNDELVEVEEHQFFTSTPTPKYSQPSSSSSSSPTFFFSAQDHGDHCHSNQLACHYEHHQSQILAPEGGSYCVEVKNMGGTNQNQNLPNQLGTSVKWMSSKMRIMRKMMSPTPDHHNSKQLYSYREDHKQASTSPETDNNSSNITIRVCSDCNTTKTPLWRSGPRGPKSLCNACGIRQRKARRAAMAAAAGNGGTAGLEMTVVIPSKSKLQCKNKRSSSNGGGTCSVAQLKKKSRLGDSQVLSEETKGDSDNDKKINDDKKLCFEDLSIILSNNSAFQRAVFPQDEKEGAILLMALSYGLVQS